MPDQSSARAQLADEEHQLRLALIVGAILFAIEAGIYIPEVFSGPGSTRPFAINSVAKDILFAALTAMAAADVVRRARLLLLVILGHAVILTLLLLALLTGNTDFSFPPPRWLVGLIPALDVSPQTRVLSWLVGAAVAVGLLVWLLHRARGVRLELRYLWPFEHATLAAVAEVTLSRPRITPTEIATRIDHYWAALDIGYKRRLRLALWVDCLLPLLFARPPLPLMEASARRRFIERRFCWDVANRSELGALRTTVQSTFRFAIQLVYLAYYGDARSYPGTGYKPFSQRPGPPPVSRPVPALRVTVPRNKQRRIKADVVIVGSGAGGALAAHTLAESGRAVLMLERGRYVPPSDFVEDEAKQYARLYSDGALQLSRDFSFQVLQGMCVGGSTVVNNGVCFDLPDETLEQWNRSELDPGLAPEALRRSLLEVRELIGARPQVGVRGNPIAAAMPAAHLREVTANLDDCLGCGGCNIGCRFNRKLSMLVDVLPRTQRDADQRYRRDPTFRGSLEILPGCEVSSVTRDSGKATGVRCAVRRPDGGTRRLEVEADQVILSAGAIHSSRILMASHLGGSRVGRALAANLGSHMTGHWPDGPPLGAFAGLQMSHYLETGPPGCKIETWFNPLMSQAMVMPGWLTDHQRNMERFDRLGGLGVIAGSTGDGNRVRRRRDRLSGAEIDFTPSARDLGVLLGGLRHAGRLMLEAGADCVMPATFAYHELRTAAELERLEIGDLVRDATDISVNTGHPQGGNPIGRNRRLGVVDEQLRVHGIKNLRVMDASVFPTAITVNPQLTVMALAHYGAQAMVAAG